MRDPAELGTPSTQNRSFTATGGSAPPLPSSSATHRYEPSSSPCARPRQNSNTSSPDTSPASMRSACWAAVCVSSSLTTLPGWARGSRRSPRRARPEVPSRAGGWAAARPPAGRSGAPRRARWAPRPRGPACSCAPRARGSSTARRASARAPRRSGAGGRAARRGGPGRGRSWPPIVGAARCAECHGRQREHEDDRDGGLPRPPGRARAARACLGGVEATRVVPAVRLEGGTARARLLAGNPARVVLPPAARPAHPARRVRAHALDRRAHPPPVAAGLVVGIGPGALGAAGARVEGVGAVRDVDHGRAALALDLSPRAALRPRVLGEGGLHGAAVTAEANLKQLPVAGVPAGAHDAAVLRVVREEAPVLEPEAAPAVARGAPIDERAPAAGLASGDEAVAGVGLAPVAVAGAEERGGGDTAGFAPARGGFPGP